MPCFVSEEHVPSKEFFEKVSELRNSGMAPLRRTRTIADRGAIDEELIKILENPMTTRNTEKL